MLFALVQPFSLLGLVAAFLLGVVIRAGGQQLLARWLTDSTRGQVHGVRGLLRWLLDPFGCVAAVLGGTGWGHAAPVPPMVFATRAAVLRRLAVYLAGPVLPILAGEAVLGVYSLVFPSSLGLSLYRPSDVLHGIPGVPGEQVLLSLGVGLLSFGVFAIVPLPPCDGWGLLWLAWRRPGERARRVRYWLEERNLGVAILLLLMLPLGITGAIGYVLLDALGTPLVRLW
ncbi:MAG TPA: hypothetical protein VGN37_09665 [Actinocatenispora sp.]